MKSLIVFSLLLSSFLILGAYANNSTWGVVGPYDRILARDFITQSGSWLKKQTAEVVYPPKGHTNFVTLTAIVARDWGNRKGFGFVSLDGGGPGFNNAVLHFKSQRGKGLNYTVEYYGRLV